MLIRIIFRNPLWKWCMRPCVAPGEVLELHGAAGSDAARQRADSLLPARTVMRQLQRSAGGVLDHRIAAASWS